MGLLTWAERRGVFFSLTLPCSPCLTYLRSEEPGSLGAAVHQRHGGPVPSHWRPSFQYHHHRLQQRGHGCGNGSEEIQAAEVRKVSGCSCLAPLPASQDYWSGQNQKWQPALLSPDVKLYTPVHNPGAATVSALCLPTSFRDPTAESSHSAPPLFLQLPVPEAEWKL